MRPRKVILLIDADEERQSVTRYLLRTHMFRVVSMLTVKDASEVAGVVPDCVLGYWPLRADIADAIATMYAIPFVLVSPAGAVTADVHFDRALTREACSPADILDAVKALCGRKRGPVSESTIAASKQAAQYLGVA